LSNKIIATLLLSAFFTGGISSASHSATVKMRHYDKNSIQLEEIKKPVYKVNQRLKPKQLKQILYSVGFRGERLKMAWATAMKESTGRPMAHNRNRQTGDNSYGLFQINMIDSLGPARRKQFNLDSNRDLFDPVRNARIAYFMSNKGKNWSAWNGVTDSTKRWLKEFPN
jgi:hypothetical protein